MKNTIYTRRKASYAMILLPLVILLLVGTLVGAAWFVTPGAARAEMGEGDVEVYVQPNGNVSLSWPAASEGASYLLYVRSGEEKDYSFAGQHEKNSALLSGVSLNVPLHLRIQSIAFAKNLLGMTRELTGSREIEVTIEPANLPGKPVISGEPRQDKTLSLYWAAADSCDYQVCSVDGAVYTPLTTVTGGAALIRFGEDEHLDMPGYDAPARVVVRPAFHGDGYVLYGDYSAPVSVERESLLGNELSLEYQETGERTYTLRWNETQGDYYEIQEWDDEYKQWETLTRIEKNIEPSYETGRLRSGSDHRYRVVAYDQEAATSFAVTENNGFSAEPDEVSFRVSVSPLYATIWPIMDLKLYDSTRQSKVLATIPGGTALCVLEESGDFFQVRYKDSYGYVDSRFCMINLPEYAGDICSYNITNSYNSVFKVHGYPISNVTWQIIPGFENVEVGENEYLVPYLYPSAKKLLIAAEAAEQDGYRLKIYEAYRPNEATRYLYDTTLAQMNNPLPATDSAGRIIDSRTGYPIDPDTGFLLVPGADGLVDPSDIPDPEPEPEPEPESGGDEEDWDDEPILPSEEPILPSEEITTGTGEDTTGVGGTDESTQEEITGPVNGSTSTILTLGQAMTDGRFKISSFLAAVTSAHNRGIALDLTLETLKGEELEMQAAMHDLSWHAAVYLNNDNAKLLAHYMHDVAGMATLSSEWWHFQDDATRTAIGLNTYLYKGISCEGWTKDDTGWRYRRADGKYYSSGNIVVDGKTYTLDGNGYVVGS